MSSGLGSRAHSPPIPSEDTPLPSYIARHFNFGFDSDDVSALITSIDASQDHTSIPSLPKLPAEVLFNIVGYVPIDYILQWRLVCRGFRDCIDGPVMYNCITRAEIIGLVGAPDTLNWAGVPPELHKDLACMRCSFERLDDSVEPAGSKLTNAKWGARHAVFRIDDGWLDKFLLAETISTDRHRAQNFHFLVERLHLEGSADAFGKMRWCMRLDSAVLDLEFPIQALRERLTLDLPSKRVMIEWKRLLFRFIQGETQLRTIMEQKRDSEFSFGRKEDCLRETRRRRLRASLDKNNSDHSLTRWGLSTLPGLFGKRIDLVPAEEFDVLKRSEDSAIAFLMPARKEAGMAKVERGRLWKLAEDHSGMIDALNNIRKLHTDWQNTLLVTPNSTSNMIESTSPGNPFKWSDDERHRKEAQVLKWKAQQANIQQVVRLFEESIEAVSVPENAFDDSGSEI
ncbi:uncharacterized protein CC84DRAFT_1151597 [Paraphaeosphaeria sporulosa]|uniref:F-box domain-containing protein n=1 Tax=Paraphaeosphaeria sporulosa TaxID=1460663 RepID=A0A177C7T3_9PLEO|nr:uncharacterized protein CC84DRAFT_1151597 [Paraphaeosphaeria sporulosa]OAG03191.1 hypothetical protein CC84DRAFT_1151597 [Paraphaeosphaeria sporulosa]